MSDIAKEVRRKYLIQLQARPLRTKVFWRLLIIARNNCWGVGWMQRCNCPKDFCDQKASVEKIASYHVKLTSSFVVSIQDLWLCIWRTFWALPSQIDGYYFQGKEEHETVAKKVLLEQLTSSAWNNMVFMMYYGLVVEVFSFHVKCAISHLVVSPSCSSFIFSLLMFLKPGKREYLQRVYYIQKLWFVVAGRPWGLVKSKVRKDHPSVQLTAWKFWPIVSWVNHQYMPLQFRVLFQGFVASCWAIFLNLRARTATIEQA
ncbi:peroxisomal membrane protein PMP22-like [Hevea brasiliensis]|uniref:peroxisomal membrane protein PMP22-like n=1 Tax=Hevea brasiliensis TaxID=3981 RepID=UPI0025F683F0|nr:peroxisomal membrane protein PMP22-like [Hevea brasiliensis]